MICTEVGELMQRQLDYDLNEQELTTLMNHLSECKACKDLFERLTLLSGSLEQLPRVTPSISIVDSIMPELDAIDRQRAKQDHAKSVHWKRWMTAAASIAAAAAVIFTMSSLAGDNKANDTSTELALSDTRISDKDYNVMSTSGAHKNFVNKSMEDSIGDPESGYHIEPLSSPIESIIENMQKNSQSTSSGSFESTYTPSPTFQANEGGGPTIESLPSEVTGPGKDTASQATEAPVSPSDNRETTIIDQSGSYQPDTADEELESSSPSFGIASEGTLNDKHFSPDGKVYIAFEGHTIVLYETSSEQKLQTWELEASGTASFIEWDAEGKSFKYGVTNDAGQFSSYTVRLN